MCGFISVFSKNIDLVNHVEKNINHLNRLIQKRGPNETKNTKVTSSKNINYFISHSLLSINDHVPQPVIKDDLIVFMNGEIYNEEALLEKNDTKWLLEFFSEGKDPADLDGEFIIHVYDKNKNTLTILSDPFATKPCFVFHNNEFIVTASYHEPLVDLFKENIYEFPPNTLMKIDLNTMSLVEKREILEWDFEPRYSSFDNWNISFKNAIQKRSTTDKNIFLGLSSGYDSGLIVSELLNLERKFNSYTIYGEENRTVLDDRIKMINNSKNGKSFIVDYDKERYDRHYQFIKNNSSNYPYRDVNDVYYKNMLEDKAAVGLSMICEDAEKSNAPIYMSGQGADEIFSDYSKFGLNHGTIRGDYTGVRSKWKNFDKSFQRNYLSKEERIPGAWGIEARYPFLDRYVVQNFLWLEDKLKNLEYKQCLANLLRKNNFPFDAETKTGFNV